MSLRNVLVPFAAGSIAVATCAPAVSSPAEATIVKVGILKDGTLVIEGKPATLGALRARLADAKSKRGVVWYFREASEGEPSAEVEMTMTAVLDMIVEHQLPVSLSSRSDYSDVIDGEGHSKPRGAQ